MSPGLKNSHSWPQSCRWTAAVASATKATDTTGPASPIRERAPFSSTMNVRLRLAAAEGLKSCFQMQAQHVSIEEMSATFHVKHSDHNKSTCIFSYNNLVETIYGLAQVLGAARLICTYDP